MPRTIISEGKTTNEAIEKVLKESFIDSYNLGTGKGYSVLQLVETFKKVNKVDVPYKIVGRRDGDIAECYASTKKANKYLGWKAELGIEEMCKDSYNFAINNK